MKICRYVHSLSGGGTERVAAILATELSRRGHQTTLFVDHDRREIGGEVNFSLSNGTYSTLVPVGNIAGFAAAIEAALDTPPSPELLKTRSADFAIGVAVGAYEHLFEKVVSGRGGFSCGQKAFSNDLKI